MERLQADSSQYYIGIMSGTSLDGVDLSLVEISDLNSNPSSLPALKSIANRFSDLPTKLKTELKHLSSSSQIDLVMLGQVSVQLAKVFAQQVNQLLEDNQLTPEHITAIGCHGVTIRHYPEIENGFSMQITDANTLAHLTGIDVIADFRGMDIASGGQGAPLVPAFHHVLFGSETKNIGILNLGGIANISVLRPKQQVIGFDTGPANTLLDQWCFKHTAQTYDKNGEWAAAGRFDTELLELMMAEPYFKKTFPKSTGKELFNLDWLNLMLSKASMCVDDLSSAQSVQTTLTHLTAKTVAEQIQRFNLEQLIVCGGGTENSFLMALLADDLPSVKVLSSSQFMGENGTSRTDSFDPNAIEAMAFAWLAYCRVHQISANSPSVTGANKKVVLGAWYSATSSDADNATGNI